MDDYIKEAFLNTLSVGIKDIQFPIDSSLFYSNYMLHYKNQDITLDLKNSSHKKIGKYYILQIDSFHKCIRMGLLNIGRQVKISKQ